MEEGWRGSEDEDKHDVKKGGWQHERRNGQEERRKDQRNSGGRDNETK